MGNPTDTPLVTFIVPTIGRTSIDETLHSIAIQTSTSWELEVVSGDGEGYQKRNLAINNARTPWVAFVDDDDTINEHYVDELSLHSDSDVVIFQMQYRDGRILPQKHEIEFGLVGISFAVKTEVMRKVLFRGPRPGEDFKTLKALEEAGANIKFVDKVLYYVRP